MKPIIFLNPVFKQMIWGGNRLATDFGYDIPGDNTGDGDSDYQVHVYGGE